MDTIKTYLDNVFAAFPQSEKVLALKREMYNGMVEKYQELKREGKSEHEAVGGVIANFGSIEEVIAELGIEKNEGGKEDSRVFLSNEKAMEYLDVVKKSSFWIGLGVWLILAGLCVTYFTSNLSFVSDFAKLPDVMDGLGILVLFGFIAVAVVIFIVNGIRLNKMAFPFGEYQKYGIRLDEQTKAEIKERNNRFGTRFVVQIAGGVVLILIAAGSFVLLDELGFDHFASAFLLMAVGFAVFLFITGGMMKAAYDLLLMEGEQKYKASAKGEKLIGTIAAVYWPLAAAIYLVWSFALSAWGISWLVWPVAGVLFAAIAGGIGVWYSQEK